MKLLLSIWPAWKESKRRLENQGEPKNRARTEFSEAVVQLERRANAVNLTAQDALQFMHNKGGEN